MNHHYRSSMTWRDLARSRLVTYGCCILTFMLVSLYLSDILHGGGLDISSLWGVDFIRNRFSWTPSEYRGGVPGFTVFDNLWFHDGHFHYFNDMPLPIDGETVTRGSDSIIQHSESELVTVLRLSSDTAVRFRGETVFVNTGYLAEGAPKLLRWYYHFAGEILAGAISALSSVHRSDSRYGWKHGKGKDMIPDRMIDHLVIPREDYTEKYGLSEMIIKGALSSALVDKEAWEALQDHGTRWVRFDRVVIVDRESASREPEARKWNKMAIAAFALRRSLTCFEPLRNHLAAYVDRPAPTRPNLGRAVGRIPKVVYVDRQDNKRRLDDDSHAHLLGVLRDMDARREIESVHGVFGKKGLEVKDQMRVMFDADIVIGVHGNGLTHQMFMAPGGVVIEIFPPDTFLRDYQVLAEALSHTHYTLRNDSIYTRPEWEHHPGEQHPERLHDGTAIPLDGDLVSTLLRMIVTDMTRRP